MLTHIVIGLTSAQPTTRLIQFSIYKMIGIIIPPHYLISSLMHLNKGNKYSNHSIT